MAKKMVLSQSTCRLLNDLTLGLEVYLGGRAKIHEIQLESGLTSGKGIVIVNGVGVVEVTFIRNDPRSLLLQIRYSAGSNIKVKWLNAHYAPERVHSEAKVANYSTDEKPVWYIGTRFDDRREEPIFPGL